MVNIHANKWSYLIIDWMLRLSQSNAPETNFLLKSGLWSQPWKYATYRLVMVVTYFKWYDKRLLVGEV